MHEVLLSKHPNIRVPDLTNPMNKSMDLPKEVHEVCPIDCTEDDVAIVAANLSGGAGPGGVDAIALQSWLLRFGEASKAFRIEMAAWVDDSPMSHHRGLLIGH